MIAMSLSSLYDEYMQEKVVDRPTYPPPPHPLRCAIAHGLSMLGLGIGGVAAIDDDALGIG